MKPFEVICIDAESRPNEPAGPALDFLGTYQVIGERLFLGRDGVYYNCFELGCFRYVGFSSDRFIRIGATSILHTENLQHANNLV
jgi:hypothetical protein